MTYNVEFYNLDYLVRFKKPVLKITLAQNLKKLF